MQVSDRIGRRLKLQDLHVLIAVVRAGSMRKAAAQLNTTQPAISRSIAELEHTIGVRLLDRTRQGILPTIYAEALLKRGNAAFDELKQGIRDIEFLADPTIGEVRIACPEIVCAGLLPVLLDRLSRRHPGISVHVVLLDTTTLEFREVRDRQVDLALTRVPVTLVDDDLAHENLLDDPDVVIAGTQSPWARRRSITLAELMGEPWVIFPSPLTRRIFEAERLNIPSEKVITTSSLLLRIELVSSGRFLSTMTRSAFINTVKHWPIKALPLDLRVRSSPLTVLTLKNRTLGPVVQLFINELRAVADRLKTS